MKALRTRLTCLYAMTTGAILFLVMASCFLLSIREIKKSQLEQFQIIWNSLHSRFLASSALSHGFLSQMEAEYQMIIHISENGVPFLYQGSWQPDSCRQTLVDRACRQAGVQGVFPDQAPVSSEINATSLMIIEGDHGDRYYAMISVAATKNGVKSLCAVCLIPPVLESLRETVLLLCLLSVLGIGCLWLISRHLAGWSLKPAEESMHRQAQFMAAASHELRSPLAVLRSAAGALLADPKEKDALLSLIDSECVRMSRLIDDMLFLASADAKSWSLCLETVDMDTLLIDLYEGFLPLCREKSVSLRLELPDDPLPRITGDPQRIRQILLILLDNGCTYTPPGRSVFIRAISGRRHLMLQVEDEGCGIPDDVKPHVFDRFYQADRSRTDKQHFGLGLSIAWELTRLHHGTIRASDGAHGGACFCVTLPISAPKAP